MRRPKYAPCSFLFPPGGCDALNTLLSLSLSLSFSLSFSVSLSLFLSLFRPFLFFPFFFLPSLGYLLYFLFARLGMACSSSASLPSRPLSSTRSRSFCAVWGCCPRRPETWLPRCSCFLFGVLPAETQPGAFLFLLGSLAPFVFCWGLRPVLGRVVFSPPEKETSRPSVRGVCVRNYRIPCHHLVPVLEAGGQRPSSKRWPTKLCLMVDARIDHPCVPAFVK